MSHLPGARPDALLFIGSGCPHCAAVLQGLNELARLGLIGELMVINAAEQPERAAEHGVRSVPWLRLGTFTLAGAHTLPELKQWAEWANGEEGVAHYVEHLLKQGAYRQAAAFIEADTRRLNPLLAIVATPAANITVRLGVSALLEAYAHTVALQNLLPQLAELARHADHRVRADACHLLGLTGSAAARAYIEPCLNDAQEEVREIANEAMVALRKVD